MADVRKTLLHNHNCPFFDSELTNSRNIKCHREKLYISSNIDQLIHQNGIKFFFLNKDSEVHFVTVHLLMLMISKQSSLELFFLRALTTNQTRSRQFIDMIEPKHLYELLLQKMSSFPISLRPMMTLHR